MKKVHLFLITFVCVPVVLIGCSGSYSDAKHNNSKVIEEELRNSQVSPNPEAKDSVNANTPQVKIETFQIHNKGWGYNIIVNGKKYVRQEHIPAVQGLHYFQSEEEARKVAAIMKRKIEKNIMPPSVTLEELDSLKIKY